MRQSTNTAIVLAAHGSTAHPKAADRLRRLAQRFVLEGDFDEAAAAFVKNRPLLKEILESLTAPSITVVPVFTSAGYFSRVVLPREMGLSGPITRREGRVIHLTDPVGEHPAVSDLLRSRVERIASRFGLHPSETAVAVVGHGTRKTATSSGATETHAESLRKHGPVPEVVTVFLDQRPEIEKVYSVTFKQNIIVLPYLIGGAGHEKEDVPARLGILPNGLTWKQNPYAVQDRLLYFAPALGDDPALFDLIRDMALGKDSLARLSTIRTRHSTPTSLAHPLAAPSHS